MENASLKQEETNRRNTKTRLKLGVIALGMVGFGYALVPLYKAICEVTGINVLAAQEWQRQDTKPSNTQVDYSRKVTVELDANVQGIWAFKPEKRYVEVHPGEIVTVNYELKNRQSRAVAGQAIPSYAPLQASLYFNKLECFCFQQQVLKAGEEKTFPVVFTIDGKLPKNVSTITLSYTFFEVGGRATTNKGE